MTVKRILIVAGVVAALLPWPGLQERLSRGLERWQQRVVGTWVAVVLAAQQEQRAAGHRRIGSEHLLVALVAVGEGPSATWLRERGCDPDRLRRRVTAAIDERAGDPQGVAAEDLAVVGADDLPVRPGASEPRRLRARDREYSPEATAVLDTLKEHVHDANAGRRPRHRQLLEDDLAFALATTRGTRAHDLLGTLGIDHAELAAVASAARS